MNETAMTPQDRNSGTDAASENDDHPFAVAAYSALWLLHEAARARLGLPDVACHCGSGAHPRACERHPWGKQLHVAELNAECFED